MRTNGQGVGTLHAVSRENRQKNAYPMPLVAYPKCVAAKTEKYAETPRALGQGTARWRIRTPSVSPAHIGGARETVPLSSGPFDDDPRRSPSLANCARPHSERAKTPVPVLVRAACPSICGRSAVSRGVMSVLISYPSIPNAILRGIPTDFLVDRQSSKRPARNLLTMPYRRKEPTC